MNRRMFLASAVAPLLIGKESATNLTDETFLAVCDQRLPAANKGSIDTLGNYRVRQMIEELAEYGIRTTADLNRLLDQFLFRALQREAEIVNQFKGKPLGFGSGEMHDRHKSNVFFTHVGLVRKSLMLGRNPTLYVVF